MMQTVPRAKLLISLRLTDCRESGQAVRKRDRTSISGDAGGFAHKVVHRHGGEDQKQPKIKNLEVESERRLKCARQLAVAPPDDG
jgi:hypothetical protein